MMFPRHNLYKTSYLKIREKDIGSLSHNRLLLIKSKTV